MGTLNYVAPEMIQTNEATLSTDIWSMGCIIYKILTGQVPFTGTNQFLVFQKILNREIEYPDFLSPEAVALIDAMLMLKPDQRLGSPDGRMNIEVLKKHPFFVGINFDNPKDLSLTHK